MSDQSLESILNWGPESVPSLGAGAALENDPITPVDAADNFTPRLLIDHISITLDLPDDAQFLLQHWIKKAESPCRRIRYRPYRHGLSVPFNLSMTPHCPGGPELRVFTGAHFDGVANTKMAWCPDQMTSAEVSYLTLVVNVGIDPALFFEARISRIDLALDVPGIRPDDLLLSYGKCRIEQNYLVGGRTRNLGARSGDVQVRCYDKRAAMRHNNGKRPSICKEPVPDHDLCRIELQLRRPSVRFCDLPQLTNPFKQLRIHSFPAPADVWDRLILRVARYEGLKSALAQLDWTPHKKRQYLRALTQRCQLEWWDAEQLWAEQFPALAENLIRGFRPKPEPAAAEPAAELLCI